jgi:hypothetical protein
MTKVETFAPMRKRPLNIKCFCQTPVKSRHLSFWAMRQAPKKSIFFAESFALPSKAKAVVNLIRKVVFTAENMLEFPPGQALINFLEKY